MSDPRSSRRRELEADEDWHRPWLAAVAVLAVAGLLGIAAFTLPRESAALPQIARHALEIALPRWGTTEPVSEIVYGSRGFDTFGETFLLLAAVVAVVVLTRTREGRSEYVGESVAGQREQQQVDPHEPHDSEEDEAREAEEEEQDNLAPVDDPDADHLGTPAPERVAGMSVVVRIAARTAAPILAVAAVYLAAPATPRAAASPPAPRSPVWRCCCMPRSASDG